MARTYYTKADLIDFAKEIVSDERRGRLQREAREKFDKGIVNFMSWSITERIITEKDFQLWKEKRIRT